MVKILNPSKRRRSKRRPCKGSITRALRRHKCVRKRRRKISRARSLRAKAVWAKRKARARAHGPLAHLVPSRMLAANPRKRRRRRARNDVRRVSWRKYPGVYNPYYVTQYGMNPRAASRSVSRGIKAAYSPRMILNTALPVLGGVMATSALSSFVTPILGAAQGPWVRVGVQAALAGPAAAVLGMLLPGYSEEFLAGGVMGATVSALRQLAPGSFMSGCRGMGCYQHNQINPNTPMWNNHLIGANEFEQNRYWENPLPMAGMNDFLVTRQATDPIAAPTMDPEFPRIAELG